MTLTRKQRIAVEVLGPPLLGFILFYGVLLLPSLGAAINGGHVSFWDSRTLVNFGFGLLAAYVFAGVPSILYMIVMEWRFGRGLNPRSWRSVFLSSLLGAISGCMISVVSPGSRGEIEPIASFTGWGLAVGFLLGIFIKTTAVRTNE